MSTVATRRNVLLSFLGAAAVAGCEGSAAEPQTTVTQRVVQDRNRITGGGVTAGIDFALTLVSLLQDENYAKTAQLMMEYDPQPPFQSGNPTVAAKESVQLLEAMAMPFHSDLDAAIDRIKAQ